MTPTSRVREKRTVLMNSRGSALLWALVSAGVMASMATVMPGYFTQIKKANRHALLRASIVVVKESVMSVLDNEAAWVKTVEANPSLACLRTNGGNCGAGPGGEIEVRHGDNSVFIANSATAGFDLQGRSCNEFNAADGHETCIFQMKVSWECETSPCEATVLPAGFLTAARPRLRLRSTFAYAPRDQAQRNALNIGSPEFTFLFQRGSQSKSLSRYCNAVQGLFNPNTLECDSSLTPRTFDCKDPAQGGADYLWFMGWDANGALMCAPDPKVGVRCPDGSGVTGYDERGFLGCQGF